MGYVLSIQYSAVSAVEARRKAMIVRQAVMGEAANSTDVVTATVKMTRAEIVRVSFLEEPRLTFAVCAWAPRHSSKSN